MKKLLISKSLQFYKIKVQHSKCVTLWSKEMLNLQTAQTDAGPLMWRNSWLSEVILGSLTFTESSNLKSPLLGLNKICINILSLQKITILSKFSLRANGLRQQTNAPVNRSTCISHIYVDGIHTICRTSL